MPSQGSGERVAASAVDAAGTPPALRQALERIVAPERVLTRPAELVMFASDASVYRMLPKAVVMARDANDLAKVFAYARASKVPITFRAGGTSLNGQSQSDGILVDVRRHWTGVEVLDDGARACERLARLRDCLARRRLRLEADTSPEHETEFSCPSRRLSAIQSSRSLDRAVLCSRAHRAY